MNGRPDREQWRSALRVGLPYVALIAVLMATRAITPVNEWLRLALAVKPFADGPAWFPLLHPGSWLLVVGLATAIAMRRPAVLALARAWTRGRKPILTIGCFLAMAQVMATSGLADGLATGLRSGLGPLAVLATPLFAAAFGFLTGSSNAANGLLMPAQIALARDAALSLPWLGAIQNTAAAALTMLSPVRVAVGCALVGKPDLERTVYLRGWPLGAVPLAILVGAAALLLVH
jgi:lactate permease